MRFVPLPLIPKEKCVKPHTKYLAEEITSSMVCAGYLKGKKDTCQVKLKFSSFKLSQEVFPTPIHEFNANFWSLYHYTEVRFASLLSGGFTTIAVINPPEKKLTKRISVH